MTVQELHTALAQVATGIQAVRALALGQAALTGVRAAELASVERELATAAFEQAQGVQELAGLAALTCARPALLDALRDALLRAVHGCQAVPAGTA